MKSLTFMSAKIFLLSFLLLTAITANAQDARLDLIISIISNKKRAMSSRSILTAKFSNWQSAFAQGQRSGREKSRRGDQRFAGNLRSRF